jgi:hypothetical protein
MDPVPIPPHQIGAVGGWWRRPCLQPRGGLGGGFGLALECLLENGTVLGLGGTLGQRRSPLQGLDETIVQATNDELTHATLQPAITPR